MFRRESITGLTRDGVSYYAPPVIHPETGKPLDLNELVRHYMFSACGF